MSTIKSFYGRVRWTTVRSRRLRIDEYLCQECKRYGKTTEAMLVHHIYPIESYWKLRYNMLNLISLCLSCHERMHDRYTDDITKVGVQWQKRIENKIKVDPPLKTDGGF